MGFYDLKVLDNIGNEISLSEYKGKILLIVNTATGCGFTPQYEYLERIYNKYKDFNFEILDFPCNQFGSQAPGDDKEINQFCTLNYHTTFKRFKKIDVNGQSADPLFKYLTSNTKFEGFDLSNKIGMYLDNMFKSQDKDYAKKSDIKWNFTKFLISKDGKILKRFEPTASEEEIVKEIEKVL